MSEDTSQPGGLKTRIVNAIELARVEQERWQAESEKATDETEQLDATIHLAASKAVLEVLEPGTHSQQQGSSD